MRRYAALSLTRLGEAPISIAEATLLSGSLRSLQQTISLSCGTCGAVPHHGAVAIVRVKVVDAAFLQPTVENGEGASARQLWRVELFPLRVTVAVRLAIAPGDCDLPVSSAFPASPTARLAPSCASERRGGTSVACTLVMQGQSTVPRKKCILVVDDEPDGSDMLAQCLGNQYDIFVAHDGLDGLEQAAKHRPDLIISDVSMPRLGGLEMVRLIRLRHGLRSPVIFLSAHGTPLDIIAGISAGARHYLTKPIDLEDLKKRVARVWE